MRQPSVKITGKVHSNVYFCRDAMLVHLAHGLDRLRWKKEGEETYRLYFKERMVVYAHIPDCGTCSDMLRRGYGDKITAAESMSVSGRINAGFKNMEQSVKDIAPLLGLFADGDYLVADYDLYPCTGNGAHFWNGRYDGPDLLHMFYAFPNGSVIYDSPLCLFPTQRVSGMDLDRVEYYKNRLSEGNRYPRAVAYYLSGGMALLLDGHHKAAAAAWAGCPVRCLVIMHADMTGCSEWMSLDQNRSFASENGRLQTGVSPMSLNDREGNAIGQICTVTNQKLPAAGRGRDDMLSEMELPEAEDTSWGCVPEELCGNIKNYRKIHLLADGMMIPKDRIRQEFDLLVNHTDPENDEARLYYLSAYCRAFPDSKWITQSQREWLKKMADPTFSPA